MQKTSNTKNQGMNPVTAGLVGAGVAVAVGTAAAVLSDKKNRTKIAKAAQHTKEQLVKLKHRSTSLGKDFQNEARKLNKKYQPAVNKIKKMAKST